MSYNYGDQGGYGNQSGYGQQSGYNQQSGYSQQSSYGQHGGYGQQGGYGNQAAEANQAAYGYNSTYTPYQDSHSHGPANPQIGGQRYEDVEMGTMNNGQPNINAIFTKCKEITDEVDDLRATYNTRLVPAQQELLQSSSEKQDQVARQKVDNIEDDINRRFRALRDMLKNLKQTPGSADSRVQSKIGHASRTLQKEIEQYQKSQNEFQHRLKDQVKRRYAIANPNATEQELNQGVESVLLGQEQTFQVAGNRTRLANDARQATIERSTAIRKIEQDMIELSRLYEEVADLINQQDVAVEQINQGAETVVDNVDKANTQIDGAIKHARNARKWKWIILIIIILIIVIVVGVAVGVVEANKKN